MIDDQGPWYQRGHRLLRVTVLAVTLAGCSWAANGTYNAAQPELTVQGDYQPLAACVRGGLAGQERDVSVAVDQSDRRARVWRQLPYQTIGADEFDVDLWQMRASMWRIARSSRASRRSSRTARNTRPRAPKRRGRL
jgi:hypothetical protein